MLRPSTSGVFLKAIAASSTSFEKLYKFFNSLIDLRVIFKLVAFICGINQPICR